MVVAPAEVAGDDGVLLSVAAGVGAVHHKQAYTVTSTDTALSSCTMTSDGVLAAAGSAGLALFLTPISSRLRDYVNPDSQRPAPAASGTLSSLRRTGALPVGPHDLGSVGADGVRVMDPYARVSPQARVVLALDEG